MSVKPRKVLQKIQWAENHVAPFNTNAVAIGTTVPEAAAFEAKTEAARNALTAAEAARAASKNASLVLKNAVAALDIAGASIIKQVRAKAESTGNTGVYALASLPAPAIPSPVAPPGLPTALKATLLPDGSLELTWDCVNPVGSQGTIYHVYRQPNGAGEPKFIGGSGAKRFIDASVPAGVAMVIYKVQGVRSTAIGVAAEFVVRLGTGVAGGTTVASVEAAGPKLAA